ncbi:MAG: hypothetical protein ABSF86_23685, partial [Steroidobacteraceae bacterium]
LSWQFQMVDCSWSKDNSLIAVTPPRSNILPSYTGQALTHPIATRFYAYSIVIAAHGARGDVGW